MEIAIIGSGSWAKALSALCLTNLHNVRFYVRSEESGQRLLKDIANHPSLSSYANNISIALLSNGLLCDSALFIIAVPIQELYHCLSSIFSAENQKPSLNSLFLLASKGIHCDSGLLSSEIFEQTTSQSYGYAVISGPNFASDVLNAQPTITSIGSYDPEIFAKIASVIQTKWFIPISSKNVLGMQLCGAMKNVIAITNGIAIGLKYGQNVSALIIQRGIDTLMRLFSIYSVNSSVFFEPAGFSDLYLTASSTLSRNTQFGINIGEKRMSNEVFHSSETHNNHTVEGLYTVKALYELLKRQNTEIPFITTLYKILFESADKQLFIDEIIYRSTNN